MFRPQLASPAAGQSSGRVANLALRLSLFALILAGSAAWAEVLVMADGHRLQVQSWEQKGRLILATTAEGKRISLRSDDVDLEATRELAQASASQVESTVARAETPPAKPSRRYTDEDIGSALDSGTGAAATGADALRESVRQALENQDLQSVMNLVNWQDAHPRARQILQRQLEAISGDPVLAVNLEPASADDTADVEYEGQRYRPNVDVTGKLVIEMGSNDDSTSRTTLSLLVGTVLDQYYIASAAPVTE